MSVSPTIEEQEHIELILEEANSVGIKYEVECTAQQIMQEDFESINPVAAYQMAYHEWIK
jgi:hypothetical protein